MSTAHSEFDQLRWLLLDEAGSAENVGTAYGAAKLFLREHSAIEIEEAVREALLSLYDEGLIRFFYSSWNDGYRVDNTLLSSLTRGEVERELASADVVDLPERVLFFVETKAGAEYFSRLPRDLVPRVSGKVPR